MNIVVLSTKYSIKKCCYFCSKI